ncbi:MULTISPECIES: FAD-dependent oxidoreductase [unclassified Streptomyces]|uniref:NAD(P)/FAD-dependent oxidoreductase n=1 Tax=unclassified Streptomyces TaxID=2593676 RepID=UPI002DD82BE3|nr:FAD-dependent oxidoreductase [Streptomyces sp. NBC_01750]WSB02932.1 FAD-dependent oxidoreductase [Streptomyces sp. NBC_01794]WSD32796.1 FAD-dependent oxidoreductase [Streptomyces sp. NBC_01750]
MKSEIVVIGGGTAGVRLARQLGVSGADVTVLGEEPHAPYNRLLLAEVLAGRYGPEVIALPEAPVRRGVRATAIDRDLRLVHCADGTSVAYDRLVLATGSNPVLPPLRGLAGELPDGVHPFRTLDDCTALSAAVRPGIHAVVVGGGLLGVSAARALAARGARVVLAQQGEHLMERHLDVSASELLRGHLESLGVEVHTECRVRGLRGTAVELADGYVLDSELVVLTCGVRPRVGLAHAAGLEVRRGIVVDDELRTSDPYIYAIGDCAEHNGQVYGLAGPALEQADVLARVLTSEPALTAAPSLGSASPRYTGTRALTRLTLTGPGPATAGPLDLAAFGDPTPRPGDDVVQLADATRGAYRKVVVRGDRLVGGVLLGDLAAVGALARAWEGDEALPDTVPLLHLLTNDGGL